MNPKRTFQVSFYAGLDMKVEARDELAAVEKAFRRLVTERIEVDGQRIEFSKVYFKAVQNTQDS